MLLIFYFVLRSKLINLDDGTIVLVMTIFIITPALINKLQSWLEETDKSDQLCLIGIKFREVIISGKVKII